MDPKLTWLAAALALGLGGCVAPEPGPSSPSPPVPPVTVPAGGVALRSLGFLHAPAGFSVPSSVTISTRVDAANNITAVFSSPSGSQVAAYLRMHLPSMGFRVTAERDGSLLFHGRGYEGALTTSGSLAALSLRTDRSSPHASTS